MRYTCKVCGGPAEPSGIRPCGHHPAGIIAHCSATCYGEGGAASNGNALSRALRRLIAAIKGAKK